VLERLRVTGSGRVLWPVLEVGGRIVCMKGVELEPEEGINVEASPLEGDVPEAGAPEAAAAGANSPRPSGNGTSGNG